MLCTEFEDRLTNYLDGALEPGEQTACAEHALRCPICHDLLNEVKNTLRVFSAMEAPAPRAGFSALEARILQQTAPESLLACEEFENYLTDYLDGFLPASLYHRWERHAAICADCGELPGLVVRSIGACYTFAQDELAVPAGLHERIFQASIGTAEAETQRAPVRARAAAWLRGWLDSVVTPQLATVAMMLLVAILVGTSTLSDDGSIGGMYRASLQFAAQTYQNGAGTIIKNSSLPDDLRRMAVDFENSVGTTPPVQMDLQKPTPSPSRSGSPETNHEMPQEPKTDTRAPASKQNANHLPTSKKRL